MDLQHFGKVSHIISVFFVISFIVSDFSVISVYYLRSILFSHVFHIFCLFIPRRVFIISVSAISIFSINFICSVIFIVCSISLFFAIPYVAQKAWLPFPNPSSPSKNAGSVTQPKIQKTTRADLSSFPLQIQQCWETASEPASLWNRYMNGQPSEKPTVSHLARQTGK